MLEDARVGVLKNRIVYIRVFVVVIIVVVVQECRLHCFTLLLIHVVLTSEREETTAVGICEWTFFRRSDSNGSKGEVVVLRG